MDAWRLVFLRLVIIGDKLGKYVLLNFCAIGGFSHFNLWGKKLQLWKEKPKIYISKKVKARPKEKQKGSDFSTVKKHKQSTEARPWQLHSNRVNLRHLHFLEDQMHRRVHAPVIIKPICLKNQYTFVFMHTHVPPSFCMPTNACSIFSLMLTVINQVSSFFKQSMPLLTCTHPPPKEGLQTQQVEPKIDCIGKRNTKQDTFLTSDERGWT